MTKLPNTELIKKNIVITVLFHSLPAHLCPAGHWHELQQSIGSPAGGGEYHCCMLGAGRPVTAQCSAAPLVLTLKMII